MTVFKIHTIFSRSYVVDFSLRTLASFPAQVGFYSLRVIIATKVLFRVLQMSLSCVADWLSPGKSQGD